MSTIDTDNVAAPMLLIGELPSGNKVYFAEEGRFKQPGIHVWNGKQHIHLIAGEAHIAQLRRDRETFAFYAANHRAKADPTSPRFGGHTLRAGAIAKAEANEAKVAEIDELIGPPPPEEKTDA